MINSHGLSPSHAHLRELPIGLFDSGVGGMTVLRAMREQLPNESFLYLGDTARMPYGTKSVETVRRYALEAAAALTARGIKLLVIACNTATAAALPLLREAHPEIDVVGVVEPGAEAACRATKSGHIAVIAPSGTIRGRAYEEAILRRMPDAGCMRAAPFTTFTPEETPGLFYGNNLSTVSKR